MTTVKALTYQVPDVVTTTMATVKYVALPGVAEVQGRLDAANNPAGGGIVIDLVARDLRFPPGVTATGLPSLPEPE